MSTLLPRNLRLLLGGWIALAILSGCGSSPDLSPEVSTPVAEVERPVEPATVWGPWKVRLTLDGIQGTLDAGGLYCTIPGRVSTNPLVLFHTKPCLGSFQHAAITVRERVDGVMALDGIFLSDLAAPPEFKIQPDRPFLLLKPGEGVIVGMGESTQVSRLKPATAYQMDLMVQGEQGAETLAVRFVTE